MISSRIWYSSVVDLVQALMERVLSSPPSLLYVSIEAEVNRGEGEDRRFLIVSGVVEDGPEHHWCGEVSPEFATHSDYQLLGFLRAYLRFVMMRDHAALLSVLSGKVDGSLERSQLVSPDEVLMVLHLGELAHDDALLGKAAGSGHPEMEQRVFLTKVVRHYVLAQAVCVYHVEFFSVDGFDNVIEMGNELRPVEMRRGMGELPHDIVPLRTTTNILLALPLIGQTIAVPFRSSSLYLPIQNVPSSIVGRVAGVRFRSADSEDDRFQDEQGYSFFEGVVQIFLDTQINAIEYERVGFDDLWSEYALTRRYLSFHAGFGRVEGRIVGLVPELRSVLLNADNLPHLDVLEALRTAYVNIGRDELFDVNRIRAQFEQYFDDAVSLQSSQFANGIPLMVPVESLLLEDVVLVGMDRFITPIDGIDILPAAWFGSAQYRQTDRTVLDFDSLSGLGDMCEDDPYDLVVYDDVVDSIFDGLETSYGRKWQYYDRSAVDPYPATFEFSPRRLSVAERENRRTYILDELAALGVSGESVFRVTVHAPADRTQRHLNGKAVGLSHSFVGDVEEVVYGYSVQVVSEADFATFVAVVAAKPDWFLFGVNRSNRSVRFYELSPEEVLWRERVWLRRALAEDLPMPSTFEGGGLDILPRRFPYINHDLHRTGLAEGVQTPFEQAFAVLGQSLASMYDIQPPFDVLVLCLGEDGVEPFMRTNQVASLRRRVVNRTRSIGGDGRHYSLAVFECDTFSDVVSVYGMIDAVSDRVPLSVRLARPGECHMHVLEVYRAVDVFPVSEGLGQVERRQHMFQCLRAVGTLGRFEGSDYSVLYGYQQTHQSRFGSADQSLLTSYQLMLSVEDDAAFQSLRVRLETLYADNRPFPGVIHDLIWFDTTLCR
ncbi:MAG: hypothetical protein AAF125_01395 [Chloroflexota bacterium]